MLGWFAASLLAGAAVVAVRWWLTRVDSLGRARHFPLITVLSLSVLGAGLFVPVVRHAQLQDRLAATAGELAGAPVSVTCQSVGKELVDVGPELGYVRYGADGVPEHATLIKREQCKALSHYLHGDRERPSDGEVVAVHVLTHEAMHMSGVTGEDKAECLAVQHDAETARLLGASPDEATRLARTYWLTVFPRMPDDYRSAECHPGGALDISSPDAPWLR
jgi:hypothetical protein